MRLFVFTTVLTGDVARYAGDKNKQLNNADRFLFYM